MTENMEQKKIVQRIPLPWAVSIVVVFSLPFGLFLGKFNFPLWVAFIVWAEYFVFGATASTWKLVIPCIPAGAAAAAVWMATTTAITTGFGLHMFWGLAIGNFIWVTTLLYIVPRVPVFSKGILAIFNGFTLVLAVYFTSSIPKVGAMEDAYWVIVLTFIWTTLISYFGWFLGWLSVSITFPKKV